jgi:hypothetical protein
MTIRHSLTVAIFVTVYAEAKPVCERPLIEFECNDDSFREAIESACREIAIGSVDEKAHSLCRCPDGILSLEVVLADGRTAKRNLTSKERILPTLKGLLLLPLPLAKPPPIEVAVTSAPLVVAEEKIHVLEPPETETNKEKNDSLNLHFVASIDLGVRSHRDGPLLVPGLMAGIQWNNWLGFLGARYDGILLAPGPPGPRPLPGRRFDLIPRLSLEVLLGPRLWVDASRANVPSDFRIGTMLRLPFQISPFEIFGQVDAELNPRAIDMGMRNLPMPPTLFQFGFSLGFSWVRA